ncbi:FtsW/RodA/SpoVE family cell cycle protein [Apilactobacillus sp. TMW 2.2459]|uniref:FtsW/RodA/SpoVE family cell cycle protein n=1 Tax=Apilactobacillus xinyiensis TaxID=2841032 RepID=UPI001C7DC892|nr:FtsW/RodA/SpoVE family cell cycle protein [Apilactobacillus xinyiensis]MCL0312390.1 FtsW/RodA/SpoVE family cell cycle protein [Apilactobacillus xinyiensis]
MKKLNTLKVHLKNLDYYIFIPYIILSLIGVIMVYSASYSTASNVNSSAILFKQFLYFFIGIIIIFVEMSGNNKIVKSKRFVSALGFILTIFLLYLMFFGTKINGAAGWINLGPINIQPAEIAKVYFIIRFSHVTEKNDMNIINGNWWNVFLKKIISSVFMLFLILMQPDLGGCIINSMIIFVMLLCTGINWKKAVTYFVSFILFILFFINVVLIPLIKNKWFSGYQADRVLSFVDPFKYQQGGGYQLINSYYALSNGGIFGKGLGNSVQKNGYLPIPYTDFIMSVISEELGVIMITFILILLTFMVCRVIIIGVRSEYIYDRLICYGIAFYITMQAFVNSGAVTGMMPITGVTFPFISYGGSSMLTLSFCIGLTLVISANQGKRS